MATKGKKKKATVSRKVNLEAFSITKAVDRDFHSTHKELSIVEAIRATTALFNSVVNRMKPWNDP